MGVPPVRGEVKRINRNQNPPAAKSGFCVCARRSLQRAAPVRKPALADHQPSRRARSRCGMASRFPGLSALKARRDARVCACDRTSLPARHSQAMRQTMPPIAPPRGSQGGPYMTTASQRLVRFSAEYHTRCNGRVADPANCLSAKWGVRMPRIDSADTDWASANTPCTKCGLTPRPRVAPTVPRPSPVTRVVELAERCPLRPDIEERQPYRRGPY